jgi:hypothetical protein
VNVQGTLSPVVRAIIRRGVVVMMAVVIMVVAIMAMMMMMVVIVAMVNTVHVAILVRMKEEAREDARGAPLATLTTGPSANTSIIAQIRAMQRRLARFSRASIGSITSRLGASAPVGPWVTAISLRLLARIH